MEAVSSAMWEIVSFVALQTHAKHASQVTQLSTGLAFNVQFQTV